MTYDPSETTKCIQARIFILPFILLISSPLSLCWDDSLISPLEASIQRLVKLSADITNFTFHPFSASSVATTASLRVAHSNSLPDLLRHYLVFSPIFLAVLDSFRIVGNRTRLIINRTRSRSIREERKMLPVG